MSRSCFAGVMMGTSVDAIDVAICRISDHGTSLELLHLHSAPIGADLRDRILRLCRNAGTVRDVCRANRDVGEAIADAVAAAIAASAVSSVVCVGSHGQTVWHEVDDARNGSTPTCSRGTASRLWCPASTTAT